MQEQARMEQTNNNENKQRALVKYVWWIEDAPIPTQNPVMIK